MEAVVSDILKERMREPGGLTQTAALSIAAHVAAVGLLAFIPGLVPKPARVAAPVMTISLGGTAGPRTGGMTMLGGRTIVAEKPLTAPKLEKMVLPTPAKAEPAMTFPIPDPKLKPRAPAKATDAKDATGRANGRGAEPQKGSTTVETGAKGQGFGLSSAGGGGTGSTLDVKDFCCPEYLSDMVNRIRSNWVQQQDAVGTVLIKFTILRNGQITDIERERPSNITALDLASERALYVTGKIAPLPAGFPDDHLTVHLNFEYARK